MLFFVELNGMIEEQCLDFMFVLDGRCFWRSNVFMLFWEVERECQIKGGYFVFVFDNEILEFFKFEILK